MGIGSGTAMLIGGLVGAGGSIASGVMGSNAAENAANSQAQAADRAAELQYQASQNALDFEKQQYAQGQQNLQPWLKSGTNALTNLNYLMGIGPSSAPQNTVFSNPPANPPTQPVYGTAVNPRGIGNGSRINPMPMSANNNVRMAGLNGAPPPNSPLMGGPQGNPLGNLPGGASNPFPTSGGMHPVSEVAPGAGFGGSVGPVSVVPPMGGGSSAPTMGGSVQFPSSSTMGGYGSLMQANPYSTFTPPDAITEQNDPGYQARLQLGQDALERSAAARGGVLTGGTAQAENQYAQDYASNEYGNVYNRAYNTNAANYNSFAQNQANEYSRLAAMAGYGQQTAQQLGMMGQNASNAISNNLLSTAAGMGQAYQNAGAANASGIVGSANAWNNALGGATNNVSNLLLMQQLMGGGRGSASGYIADSGY